MIMGTPFSVVILVGVEVNYLVCVLSDGDDGVEEKGPIFFTDVSGTLLALIASFSCSNLSNFLKLGSYRSLCCFPYMWLGHYP